MRKALSCLLFVLLASCSGSGGGTGTPDVQTLPPTMGGTAQTLFANAAAPVTWNVGTGTSSNAYALQGLDYYPKTITVDAGDSIAYSVASGSGGDAHTISFVPAGQPIPSPGDPRNFQPAGGTAIDGTKFVNSGILFGGQVFTYHFPRPGTYRILCLFHEPAMESTVVVQRAGTPYPHTASFYAHVSADDRWDDLGAARQSISLFPFRNGGTTLAAGISPGLTSRPPSESTVLRYLDSNKASDLPTAGNITIRVGTTLTWVNESSNEPHTVTIVHAGATDLPNIAPDPAFGGHVFDGTHDVNSGTFVGGQRFSARFTRVGRFLYGCLYHDNSRMEAWVTVTP